MQQYIIRRVLLLIPTILVVSIIVFLLVRFIPGDALDVIQSHLSGGGAHQIDREEIGHILGLDVPFPVQYVKWVGGIITQGDFGTSIIQQRPVLDIVLERLPVTLEIGILAVLLKIILGISLGVYSAIRQDSVSDYILRTFAIIAMAMPPFWIGTMVIVYASVWWNWCPPMVVIPFTEDPLGNLGMFILPAFILCLMTMGATMRLTRTMMLEVMRQDYIKAAWAKGLTERVVIARHAIKNAFIPVLTSLGHSVAMIVGGNVIIERIFNMPGVGMLLVQALNERDYPIVSAITLMLSAVILVGNLLIDISYTWLDPRIRYD